MKLAWCDIMLQAKQHANNHAAAVDATARLRNLEKLREQAKQLQFDLEDTYHAASQHASRAEQASQAAWQQVSRCFTATMNSVKPTSQNTAQQQAATQSWSALEARNTAVTPSTVLTGQKKQWLQAVKSVMPSTYATPHSHTGSMEHKAALQAYMVSGLPIQDMPVCFTVSSCIQIYVMSSLVPSRTS
jgi:hypothetical protein